MSERIENLLLTNMPQIFRMVGSRLDQEAELAVRNALFAMAGELSDDQTIVISQAEGPARIEGLGRARDAIREKLDGLPADKRESDAAQQLAICGHAVGEIQDSFTLAMDEGLDARVNVRRLAEAIEAGDEADDGEAEDGAVEDGGAEDGGTG